MSQTTKTIRQAISFATQTNELPLNEAVLLLSHVLHLTKEEIYIADTQEMSEGSFDEFKILVERRLQGVPIAYLRGKKEFFNLTFKVTPDVLIPRPETELVVETALTQAQNITGAIHIVDVGTGSGAIAVSLAKNIPGAQVTAIDISDDALLVALKNAQYHEVNERMAFMQGDLLTPLLEKNNTEQVHIIAANLPYIARGDTQHVEKEVHAYEPHTALYSGETGVEHYARLFEQTKKLPQLPHAIIGEIGIDQSELIQKLVAEHFDLPVTILPDLAGIPRVFLISCSPICLKN